jgi:hypothetical protein
MKKRRNVLKNVGIMVIALAMCIAGIAMADPGITATKQISFVGENGAEIISTDGICASGSGPGFCNTVEAGSSFTMGTVNAMTGTNAGFVTASATMPMGLDYTIRIDSLGDSPSIGKVSAFIKGTVQEGKGGSSSLFGSVEFEERTSMDGRITLFDKEMHWESGSRRV